MVTYVIKEMTTPYVISLITLKNLLLMVFLLTSYFKFLIQCIKLGCVYNLWIYLCFYFQISLGRMAIDILKFLTLYLLVLFAFACGMNQLLWYYADLEYEKCYSLPGGQQNLQGEVKYGKHGKVVKLRPYCMHCIFYILYFIFDTAK